MKRASLYVLTALVTGLHNFYWLMSIVNGAPLNPLNCAALAGSALLLVAAVILLFRTRIGALLALAGSALSWVFYAPFIVVSAVMPFSTWLEIRGFISYREYVPLAGIFFAPILLLVCTVDSIRLLRRSAAVSATS
jgi:hypothetical protein